ncbi:uridine kinase family-domain-containing protein [Lipomyces japonicus]|uniref:uridine kinase family-domain-containing protein n=1 Tax=Lipomyces japonicus TaxID=56871 RepID=UPI0034CFBAE7
MSPTVVAIIAGGQAAGKKSVSAALKQRLSSWQIHDVEELSLDKFKAKEVTKPTNIEGPDAYDFELAVQAIKESKSKVFIVEGLYSLYSTAIRELGTIKIYVDLDADTRLSRRILRDTTERGISLQKVLDDYLEYGKPAMERYIQGTKTSADVILMRGAEPSGIELIAGAIYDRLLGEGAEKISWQSLSGIDTKHNLLESHAEKEKFYELA